jgi:hypothetical protein
LFYFLKDIVLVAGVLTFGISPSVLHFARALYAPFGWILATAVAWTWLEIFNAGHVSFALGFIGFRAYWLWWLAPLLIASVIATRNDRTVATAALAVVAIIVAAYASVQFASPPGAAINSYAEYEGRKLVDVATVATTGRARVSGTFSYITGFSDFVTLVPAVILALGLGEAGRWTRWLALAGAAAASSSIAMSGSRSPVILSGVALLIVAWSADFLRSRAGRRIALATAVVFVAGSLAVPEAVRGVQDRFRGDDTESRLREVLDTLPFVAIGHSEYPTLGEGTGMEQNARMAFQPGWSWKVEPEAGRVLLELGPIGYLLVWLAKLGLVVALFRAGLALRSRGDGPISGAAFALSVLTLQGGLVLDHVHQALLFIASGLVLGAAADSGQR